MDRTVRIMIDDLISLRARIQRMRTRSEGEDLYQDVWVEVLKRQRQVDLKPVSVLTIARRRSIDRHRRNSFRQHCALIGDIAVTTGPEVNPGLVMERAEEVERLYEAMKKLTPFQREAVESHYFRGEKDRETADRKAVPIETLRYRRKCGLEALRGMLLDPLD